MGVRVKFAGESAAFANLLGWYDRTTLEAGLIDPSALASGSSIVLPVSSEEFGFFLIPDGETLNKDSLTGPSLEVRADETGRFGLFDTARAAMLEGRGAPAFFTDAALNADGRVHHLVRALEDSGKEFRIHFEDLMGLGDVDLNDLVIDVAFDVPPASDLFTGLTQLLGSVVSNPIETSEFTDTIILSNAIDVHGRHEITGFESGKDRFVVAELVGDASLLDLLDSNKDGVIGADDAQASSSSGALILDLGEVLGPGRDVEIAFHGLETLSVDDVMGRHELLSKDIQDLAAIRDEDLARIRETFTSRIEGLAPAQTTALVELITEFESDFLAINDAFLASVNALFDALERPGADERALVDAITRTVEHYAGRIEQLFDGLAEGERRVIRRFDARAEELSVEQEISVLGAETRLIQSIDDYVETFMV